MEARPNPSEWIVVESGKLEAITDTIHNLKHFEEKTENSSERVYGFLLYHNVRSGPFLPNSYQSVSVNIEWTHFVPFTWQDIYKYHNRLIW